MREIKIGSQNFTKVIAIDKPGYGGAYHEYRVVTVNDPAGEATAAMVSFQNGPVKEFGVNGCHQEDLLAIVLDRLESFQAAGEWRCRENALAITKIEEAMHWLNHRTATRVARGVEGTHKK